MKKLLIVVLLLLAGGFAFGQKGEIVYTEYEPPVYVHYIGSDGVYDTIYFDIDHNGISEFRIEVERMHGFIIDLVLRRNDWYAHHENWHVRVPYDVFAVNNVPLTDTIHFGDTISNIPEETWYKAYRFRYYSGQGVPSNIGPDDHIYLSFRKATEDGFCYGWMDMNIYFPPENWLGEFHVYVSVYRTAYCTIPDYPLCVGQTCFDWADADENNVRAIATVHPNPTTGTVSVSGLNLRQADVYNALGQLVATATGNGSQITVDLNGLPAGLYFVNITDSDGRMCVRKVVKQ